MLAVFAIALVAYWPGLDGPFIFDSTPNIRDNPQLVFEQYSFDEWYSAAYSTEAGPLGRPLSMLSFALNAAFSGLESAFAFKLTNLLIHCANAVLVFLCVAGLYAGAPRLARRDNPDASLWIALIAASIFLLHPIQLPSVLHAVQRMAELAFTFELLALLVYLRQRKRAMEHGFNARIIVDTLCLVGLCTLLGSLCKENALLTPWLIIVVEALFFGFRTREGQIVGWFRTLGVLLFLAPPVVVSLYLLICQPDLLPNLYAHRDFDLAQRVMTQARVLWMYIFWFMVPGSSGSGLHHDDILIARHLWESLTALAVCSWAAIVVALSLGLGRRYPLPAFAFAWYLVAHSMESTIIPLEMVYEHRNYAAIFGLVILVADLLWKLGERFGANMRLALSSVVLIALVVPLAMRAQTWGDELELAARQLAEHPGSLRSRYHYANVNLRIAEGSHDPDTTKAAVLVADYYYRQMLELDREDLVALVTLLYIDGKYLGSSRQTPAYSDFLRALDKKVLLTTDYIALRFFKDCSVQGYCVRDASQYWRVLDILRGRSEVPRSMLSLMQATYIAGSTDDLTEAATLLRKSLAENPGTLAGYPILARWEITLGDTPAAFDTLRSFYASDSHHHWLATMRRLTDPAPPQRGSQ